MKMMVALTKFHVSILPLLQEDGIIESNYFKRMSEEYRWIKRKHKLLVRNHYKQKQARARMVYKLLDNAQEAHDIAGLVEDDPGNPEREG